MANKRYKFRIYPNKDQEALIIKTFGCVRFVYNYFLTIKQECYNEHGSSPSAIDCNNICNRQLKNEYEWLREPDKFALTNAIRNLDSAYNSLYKKNNGFPKYKSKKESKQSYSTNNNIDKKHPKGSIEVNYSNKNIKLPKLGWTKCKFHRQISTYYKIKGATITRENNKYYVSILTEYEENITQVIPKTAIGLDFSLKNLVVDSEGVITNYPHFYKKSEKKLAKAQRKMDKKENSSNNRIKQKFKLGKIHAHIANQRKDYLHKLSKWYADNYDIICVEDINLLDMSNKHSNIKFGKSISDKGFGMFRTFLQYKLHDRGKLFFKIDKWFPSSKKCSQCGNVKDELDLEVRTYVCEKCGLILDRDINAAINIRTAGTTGLALAGADVSALLR